MRRLQRPKPHRLCLPLLRPSGVSWRGGDNEGGGAAASADEGGAVGAVGAVATEGATSPATSASAASAPASSRRLIGALYVEMAHEIAPRYGEMSLEGPRAPRAASSRPQTVNGDMGGGGVGSGVGGGGVGGGGVGGDVLRCCRALDERLVALLQQVLPRRGPNPNPDH